MTQSRRFTELKFSLKAATPKRNRPDNERTSIDKTTAVAKSVRPSHYRSCRPFVILPGRRNRKPEQCSIDPHGAGVKGLEIMHGMLGNTGIFRIDDKPALTVTPRFQADMDRAA